MQLPNSLIFHGSLECPQCHKVISDSQFLLELYLRMKAQSVTQNEPQIENFVDIYKCGDLCPKCLSAITWVIKFVKIGQFVKIESLDSKYLNSI